MGTKILVLNHTRMGDLIQTTPLIKELKAMEPDCEITMLANAKFSGILDFAEGIDEVIPIDFVRFRKGVGDEPDVLMVYEYFERLADDLRSRRFEKIVNLSHSKFSAILSLLIGAKDIRGFLSTPRGERLIRDPWLLYFSTFLGFRKFNRFNIVDLYMRGAGINSYSGARLSLQPDKEAIKEKMAEFGVSDGDVLIGLQAGASRRDRRWSPESFAKVADRLSSSRGVKIVLFGSASEKELGDEVETAMETPAINLIGKTSLSELAAWVDRVDLLVTNDTGTMHIAAAVETQIVALFFVHARAEETGPYCEGAYILQADIECAPCSHRTACDHYSCLTYIDPEDVIAVCEAVLDNVTVISDDPGLFKRTRVLKSGFHEDGGIEFVPMSRKPLDKHELFAYLYRPIFNEAASRWSDPDGMSRSGELVDKAISKIADRFLIPQAKDFKMWLTRAEAGCQTLIELGQKGAKIASMVAFSAASKDSKGLGEIAQELEEISFKISILSETHEAVAPLAMLFRRRVENMEGDDPIELARQMDVAFRWLISSGVLVVAALGRVEKKLLTDKVEEALAARVISEGK